MDRTADPRRVDIDSEANTGLTDDTSEKPEVEPDTWRDLTEFRDKFSDDTVFGVLAIPDDSAEGFWIVRDIEKVRPAAVPIDQPATFDMNILGPDGKVVDEIRLIIEDIEHIRAAELLDNPRPEGDGV